MRKVRIKSMAKKAGGGNMIFPPFSPDAQSEPDLRVSNVLKPVDREDSNMEAEKGETAYLPDVNGLAAHYKIAGAKHSNGGTPLNLPDNAFIFSDTHKLKIKDPEILKSFGKTSGKYTPADLAKQYEINKYRKILADPSSDKLMVDTAEKMISNYNIKLGKLALVQEAKKGFPNGIPEIALPYLAVGAINPDQILPLKADNNQFPTQAPRAYSQKDGGSSNMGNPYYKQAGGDNKQASPTQGADYYTQAYTLLQNTLTSPENEKLRDKLYEDWKNRPENKGKALSKDQVINTFLEAQKQIFAIQKAHPDATSKEAIKSKKWDRGTKKNEMYNKEATALGLNPLKEDDIKTFQSTYQVLSDLADNPEFSPILSNFNLKPVGVSDQTYGKDKKAISPVDGWFGNTTVGQAVLPKTAPAAAQITPEVKQPDAVTAYTQPKFAETKQKPFAPWWKQDVVKTAGSAADFMRIKKYLPWAPPINPYVPDATFYDPTRELASNAEQMNIGTQGANAFSGPQAYNARFSQIQGQGAKNAADILSKYNNMNVGAANQFSALKGDIMNKAGMANASLATKLYDDTTIANQQFDNAKNMARQELRSSYIDAVTNRANAQVMNNLYPHYKIDPITGGMMGFYKGSKLKPGATGDASESAAASFAQLVNKYPQVDQAILAKMAGMGPISPDDNQVAPDAAEWFKKFNSTIPNNYPNNQ